MAKQTTLDIEAATLGGVNILGYLDSGELTVVNDTEDGSTIVVGGETHCVVKKSGTLNLSLLSDSAEACRVSNLDISVLTQGGVDILGNCISGDMSIGIKNTEGSGAADIWKYPEPTGISIDATTELVLPVGTNPIFGSGKIVKSIFSNTLADMSDLYIVLSITINSVAITLPVTVTEFSHMFDRDDMMHYRFSYKSNSPGSGGTFPTAPTGSTTLLEKILNAYRVPVALDLDTGAAGAGDYQGNFVFQSCNFGWDQGSLIKNDYTLLSYGAIAESGT